MCALSVQAAANLKAWQGSQFDQATRRAVTALAKQGDAAVEDAFGDRLMFGTAGLRGMMGMGPNRLNRYTIAQATEALARYLESQKGSSPPRVLIGYDSRHQSSQFAEIAARVLAAHGFDVQLFSQMRPVPWVSFGVRHLGCQAGIMITASHNPAIYNGYKVYGPDGAQIVSPADTSIMEQMQAIADPSIIPLAEPDDEHITRLFDELDDDYISAIQPLQNRKKENRESGSSLRVLYSSLHGTGITVIDKVLASWGFTQLAYVASQIIPDGDFPTAPYPNPEKLDAMRLGLEQLEREHADVLIVNDPDADRIGIACMSHGQAVRFTGNEFAMLVLHYLGECWPLQRPKARHLATVKTIVTTEGLRAVARRASIDCFDVLTGFKFIGQLIGQWEHTKAHTFLFGGEESYGCLYGTQTRDKDGICMAALVCEITLYCKQQGMTLADYWDQIERQVGVYRNRVTSIEFPETEEGHKQMKTTMEKLRASPLTTLADLPVLQIRDYLQPQPASEVTIPLADVLQIRLPDDSSVIVRPSGTEPKIKIYAEVAEPITSTERLEATRRKADDRVEALLKAAENAVRSGSA